MAAGSYPGQASPIASVGSWSFIMTRPTLSHEVAYRVARALHRAEPLAARLAQARETTAANTVAAVASRELIHPGVRAYLAEIGLV